MCVVRGAAARQTLREMTAGMYRTHVSRHLVGNLLVGRQGMMRKFVLLLSVLVSFFCALPAYSGNKQAAIYKGLEPGVATLQDTIRILGTPVSKRMNDTFTYCKYRAVDVAIEKKSGKVGIIIIYDPTFKDVNGFMIGDSYEKIRNYIKDAGKGNVLFDKSKNVIYLFNQENVLNEIAYGVLTK